ncbi:phosphotransferase enzyme family protein [Pseudoalteromonas rubra]|uniref:Aminoglycoside phosphotransferase n=1 Tax=Pseudoalteromonas rubra TaxID=43658 RepID=A0A0F4R0A5_9GAMM|nr:aminoglycoside phosphotransferase family protein [Pseudoalteromonas rubra]KJZ12262.1 aminoglycoside phosphotransferase [Pseudoalteromonas rubra]
MKNRAIAEVLSQHFGLQGASVSLRPIGNGHINTTMLLKNKQRALVVQKLNTCVFPEPEQLVTNARKIEQHLARKARDGEYELAIIRHVPTIKGEYLVHHEDEVWRALEFIGGSYSEDVVDSEVKAKIAANAFGQFAAALDDFDATQLHHVIPNFHNLAMRIEKFEETLSQDPLGRAALCQAEIAFCRAQFSLAQEVVDVEAQLPLRACHNDTKINNMLFCSESNKARAVIDLDTCMPGYWLYDFGDMVRTFCSPEAEDSTNLTNVRVREEIFAALVRGYKHPLSASLTDSEKQSFILGAKVMPFMIGLRFLTDYLDGDNYFATKHPEHNLQRAQNQFALYQDIVAKQTQLSHIIDAA